VPSTSSAISIQHAYWTEHDWYTRADTGQVVQFQGTTRHNLGVLNNVLAVSASYDPYHGGPEVFALNYDWSSHQENLWLCDATGQWNPFGGDYRSISATHDGHVYAISPSGQGWYFDSLGNGSPLGAPPAGLNTNPSAIAASVGWHGDNEVFAIGSNDGAIYVNSTNSAGPGHWRRVDNSADFWSLSATQNDTVFATDYAFHLHQETEHVIFLIYPDPPYIYWTGQDISGGRDWSAGISADQDANGHDEVYAIERGTSSAYLYNQGSWTSKDSNVAEIAGADSGYFYDVNHYTCGEFCDYYYAYQWDPSYGWTYLRSDVH
jgi:hypothetical protein